MSPNRITANEGHRSAMVWTRAPLMCNALDACMVVSAKIILWSLSRAVTRCESDGAALSPLLGRHQLFDIDQLGRIVACVAGVAVFVFAVVLHCLPQRSQGKIGERIGLNEAPDLLDGIVR